MDLPKVPAPKLRGGQELRAGLLAQRTSRKPVRPKAKSRAGGACLVPKPVGDRSALLSPRQPLLPGYSGW